MPATPVAPAKLAEAVQRQHALLGLTNPAAAESVYFEVHIGPQMRLMSEEQKNFRS